MKISAKTLQILKNFQSINKSILIKPGNEIRTISDHGSIFAVAKLEEVFPEEVGIYDLSKLLNTLALYDEPNIKFTDKYIEVSESGKKRQTKLVLTNPSMINSPPYDKTPKIHDVNVEFLLSREDFRAIMKNASNLGVIDFEIKADGESLYVGASDTNNVTSDMFYIELGETDQKFRFVINTENMKFIDSDYKITVGSGKIMFENDSVTYYVALDSNKSKI